MLLVALLLVSVSPNVTYAAIARDSVSSALDGSGTATTISVSHTVTGTNTILIECVVMGLNQTATATYNSVAMTSIGRNFGNRTVQMFYMINPPTGTHTLTAAWPSPALAYIEGMSYTGSAQSGQPDSSNSMSKADSDPATQTLSTTVIASNAWLTGCGYSSGGTGTTYSAGTGTSINVTQQNVNATEVGIDSNGIIGTGSQSMVLTQSISNFGGMVIASIAPFVSSSTGVGYKLSLTGIKAIIQNGTKFIIP